MRRRGWAGSVVSEGRGGTSWRGDDGSGGRGGPTALLSRGDGLSRAHLADHVHRGLLDLVERPHERGRGGRDVGHGCACRVGVDGREGRGDASGWASGSLSWRRFGNEMRERCNRTSAPRGARRRGYAMRSGGRAVLRRRHRASTRARDAAASFARALPIPRPSAAPNEGDRSARPHRADNRATVTARGVSRRATRAGGTRRDVSRVCASAWVRGTHLLRRSGLRGSVCRALRRPQAQEQTRGSRSSVGFRSRIRMAAS